MTIESWLEDRVCLALKVRPDRFKKLVASDDAARPLLEFLHNPDSRRVWFADEPKALSCFATPPTTIKRKLCYFLKLHRVVVTEENMRDELVCGDMMPGVLEHLFKTCMEVQRATPPWAPEQIPPRRPQPPSIPPPPIHLCICTPRSLSRPRSDCHWL